MKAEWYLQNEFMPQSYLKSVVTYQLKDGRAYKTFEDTSDIEEAMKFNTLKESSEFRIDYNVPSAYRPRVRLVYEPYEPNNRKLYM